MERTGDEIMIMILLIMFMSYANIFIRIDAELTITFK